MKKFFTKEGIRDVIRIVSSFFSLQKKEYFSFILLIFFGISIIWLGGMIAVIGSRQIVKPVHVVVSDASGHELQSVRVFVKLARAGNAVLTRKDKYHGNQWSIDQVFIEKIMIGATSRDLQRISNIGITIGGKEFSFAGAHELAEWGHFDKSIVKPYIKETNYNDYTIVEVPSNIRLETSNIPFRKTFFSSLVNWGGDYEVFIKPLAASSGSILLYVLFLFILRAILLRYEHKNIRIGTDTSNTLEDKERYILFFLVIISTAVALAAVNTLIYFFYKPDVAQILKEASSLYLNYQLPAFLPKHVERLQFMMSAVLSPVLLWGFYYYIFKDWMSNTKASFVDYIYPKLSIITICLLFALTYLGLAMSDFLYIKTSYFFEDSGKYFFSLLFFPTALYIFLMRADLLKLFQKYIRISFKAIFLITILLILTMSMLNLGSFFSAFHLNPVFYPISQIVAGKSLLVNVTSLYGLFPVFLAPIFMITGLSLLKFSLVMAIILCVSYLLLFAFMRKAISNYALLYSGFLGIVFYSYLAHSPTTPDYYFQYWPIRLLFPAIFLFMIASFLKEGGRRLYYSSLLSCAIGVLWNFDSGIIVFLTWIIVMSYHEFSKANNMAAKFIKTGGHVLAAAGLLTMVILSFCVYTYAASGIWPNASLFLQYQKMFLSGYFMIPMLPPPHSWNVVALTYLAGLLLSVVALLTKKVTYWDKLIFTLSILGVGLFSYYEGRSHDLVLFAPSYIAFILVAMFTDRLYSRIKTSTSALRGEILLFAFLFFIVISAPFNIIYNIKTYVGYIRAGVTSVQENESSTYSRNITFINQYIKKGEGIFILAPHNEGIYYGETGTYSAVDIPSSTDLFFKREADAIVTFLETNDSSKIFAEQPLSFYDLYDSRIKKTLEEHYVIISSSTEGLSFLMKK